MASASEASVLAYVAAMDAALLPCLPARELQAADRTSHPSLHVDVERHNRDFMDAANKLLVFFLRVGHQYRPTREKELRDEIAALEGEISRMDELVDHFLRTVQTSTQVLTGQREKCESELKHV